MDHVLLPVALLSLGVLMPVDSLAWKIDPYEVDPAILVDVKREVKHGVAPFFFGNVEFGLVDFVPDPVWGFKPEGASHDVGQAVVVDIAYGHSFGDEFVKEDGFFEGDVVGHDVVFHELGIAAQGKGKKRQGKSQ
tara:strand:- start:6865 stop:7269 length:405 start_codon:yes stop_codon:yes gene_type:complete